MSINITVSQVQIENLDLSPIKNIIEDWLANQNIIDYEQKLQFKIDYPRPESDPRELSEIPEVRLWFIALDAYYPWLPLFVNWREGELSRYTAMLVPHRFNRSEGIQYNPEALDIFIMNKIFVVHKWLRQQEIMGNSRLKAMAQIFGYNLDDNFFSLLD
jgi:hypothetical protein